MSDAPYEYDEPRRPLGPDPNVRGRVMPPAIFLIVVAVINLLVALGCLGFGAFVVSLGPDKLYDMMEKQYEGNEAMEDALKQQDPASVYRQALGEFFGAGAVGLVVSLVVLFGAIRMMSLKSYGLAVVAAILAAIPCISPSGCCLLGEIAGIWALIVLLNTDVRSAFR